MVGRQHEAATAPFCSADERISEEACLVCGRPHCLGHCPRRLAIHCCIFIFRLCTLVSVLPCIISVLIHFWHSNLKKNDIINISIQQIRWNILFPFTFHHSFWPQPVNMELLSSGELISFIVNCRDAPYSYQTHTVVLWWRGFSYTQDSTAKWYMSSGGSADMEITRIASCVSHLTVYFVFCRSQRCLVEDKNVLSSRNRRVRELSAN